jgi:phosphoglycolate phosphatase
LTCRGSTGMKSEKYTGERYGRRGLLKGVIFDMDGTITVPYINWKALRERIGAVPDQTIMQFIEDLPPERLRWANDELLKAEMEAAQNAAANEGLAELMDYLRGKGLRLAVVTNSHGAAMRTVLERHHLTFDVALSRDDGEIKPSSFLIARALQELALPAGAVMTIGDGRYDIEASERVGVRCIYLTHGHPTLDHQPAVATLRAIRELLESNGFLC